MMAKGLGNRGDEQARQDSVLRKCHKAQQCIPHQPGAATNETQYSPEKRGSVGRTI